MFHLGCTWPSGVLILLRRPFFNDFKYYWCPVIISKPKHFRWPFGCFTLVLIWPLVVIIHIWQLIPVWRTPHLCYIWPLDVLAGAVWPGLRFDPAALWPLSLIRLLAVGTTGSGLQPLGRKEKSVPRESLQTILCMCWQRFFLSIRIKILQEKFIVRTLFVVVKNTMEVSKLSPILGDLKNS